jgi:hypothetical protein
MDNNPDSPGNLRDRSTSPHPLAHHFATSELAVGFWVVVAGIFLVLAGGVVIALGTDAILESSATSDKPLFVEGGEGWVEVIAV